MTRLEIQTYALNMLQANVSGVDGAGIWSATELQQYIRDAELDLFLIVAATHENFFRTSSTLSEVAGTALISLPTNTYRLLRLERLIGLGASSTNPAPMIPVDRNDSSIELAKGRRYPFDNDGTGVYPMYYQMHGQKQIELLPTPSISATDSLKVIYVYRPAAMTADSHVPFQSSAGTGGAGTDNLSEFHDIIALSVVEKCMVKEESFAQSDRIRALRMEREAKLRQYLTSTQTQATRGMHVSSCEYDW